MSQHNFSFTMLTGKSPEEVFNVITHPQLWWSGYYAEEFEGEAKKLNDEFSFRAGPGVHYSKQKLVEVIPGKRIVWLVTESELTFLKKKDEWTGTRIVFEISLKGNQTELIFTHEGLHPEVECYDACAPAWSQYLQNKLLPIIQGEKTGKSKETGSVSFPVVESIP